MGSLWAPCNGLEGTRGALIDVSLRDHRIIDDVLWPTRFEETVQRPIRVMVHCRHVTGLDTNRGLACDDVAGPAFRGAASSPARELAPST